MLCILCDELFDRHQFIKGAIELCNEGGGGGGGAKTCRPSRSPLLGPESGLPEESLFNLGAVSRTEKRGRRARLANCLSP